LHKSVVAPSPELGRVQVLATGALRRIDAVVSVSAGTVTKATDPHPGPCLSSHEAKGTDILLTAVPSDHLLYALFILAPPG